MEFDLVISKEYPEDKFNLLTPMKTVTEISEIHKPVMNVVRISTAVADKEIYEQDRANHGWAITKKGLEKLMRAAGIKIVDSKPIIPSTCRKCAEINRAMGQPVNCYKCGNKDVAHEVTISVPQLTGENIEITKTKEICVEEVIKTMRPKQAEEFMKFRCEMCETKAMNRALRSAMHIKGTYTLQELQKPFVVAYLVPNLDNPDVRGEAVKKMFSASDRLFPTNAIQPPPETSPDRTLATQQEQVQSLPQMSELPMEEEPPYMGEPPYMEEPPYYEEQYQAPPQVPEQSRQPSTALLCSNCRQAITAKVFDYSKKFFGAALCINCQRSRQG